MRFYVIVMIVIFYFTLEGCKSPRQPDIEIGNFITDTVKKTLKRKGKEQLPDTIVNKPDTLVIKDPAGFIDTMLRFSSRLFNKQFLVSAEYNNRPAKLDFSTCIYGKRFKTRTNDAVKETGLNFAGKYTFVSWGCGSPCKMSAVVDLQTGKVYAGPPACYKYVFDIRSKVLQVDPPDTNEGWYYSTRICLPPQEYFWDGKNFILVK